MTTQPSDYLLIQQAQSHDLDAFNQLVLMHQDNLYRYAVSLVNDPDLAEDIVQESLIKAFQHIHALQGNSFRAWLFKIVTNTARDHTRRILRHPNLPLFPKTDSGEDIEDPDWLTDRSPSVEAISEQRDDILRLEQALSALPETHRTILLLIDVYEMNYIEAAQALNIPLGTVKSRLARARLQMQNQLQGSAKRKSGYNLSNASYAM